MKKHKIHLLGLSTESTAEKDQNKTNPTRTKGRGYY